MSIDVLIPSYNRAHFVTLQLASLVIIRDNLLQDGITLRVVISDNQSKPAVQVPAEYSDFVKVYTPPKHLPTAEENVYWGIQRCEADYVWLLGDDDSPVIENALSIIRRIQSEKPEISVANAGGALASGELFLSRTMCSDASKIRSLPDFVQRTGLMFVLAGFSCIICKREKLASSLSAFEKYFSISKIYSLVFWIVDTYWDSSFIYCNEPIVIYKQNVSDLTGDHWIRVASNQQVFQRYFWTLGLVRLCQQLINAKGIRPGFFSRVIDYSWGNRYLLLVHCVRVFIDQISDDIQSVGDQRCRSMTLGERNEFIQFMIKEEPRMLEVYSFFLNSTVLNKDVLSDIRRVLAKYENDFFSIFFVESIAGWNIYHFDGIFRALPYCLTRTLTEEILDISPVSSEYQLVAESVFEIKKKVLARPFIRISMDQDSFFGQFSIEEASILKKWVLVILRLRRIIPLSVKKKLMPKPYALGGS